MEKIWKRVVLILLLGWSTAMLLFIWFAAREPDTNLAQALHRMIKQIEIKIENDSCDNEKDFGIGK